MKINKLTIIFSLFIFSSGYSQIEEINNIDNIFDKKTQEIQVKNKASKKYWKFATKINSERIAQYDKLLDQIYEKDSVEIPELKNQTEEKIISYKNNGIGGFRIDISKNIDLTEHPNLPNLVGTTIKTELKWVIDENGKIRKVEAKGENAAFNTLSKIALFKTNGNWIPAQKEGRNIKSSFRFPITSLIE